MRPMFLAKRILLGLALLALPGCLPSQPVPPESTALPPLIVTRVTNVVQPDRVMLVWSVQNAAERRFEIRRKNRDEPWKHVATLVPVDGSIEIDDTGVLPGQRYLYQLRLFEAPGDAFLDQFLAVVPFTN